MYILFLINLIVELINQNLTLNILNTCVLITLVALILLGWCGLIFIIKNQKGKSKKCKIVSKKNLTDQHFLNYFSLFVLLALAFDLSKFCFVCVFIVLHIFIGVVYIKNNIFYVNPLLNILGYSFYDITIKNGDSMSELRIFFKGEIEVDKNYSLYIIDRNLNFLQ